MPSVIVNKYNLNIENKASIRGFCEDQGIPVLGMISFDENVTKTMVQAKPVVVFSPTRRLLSPYGRPGTISSRF